MLNYRILIKSGQFALLEANTQYIVACGYDETRPKGQQWGHGHYFEFFFDADKKADMLAKALDMFRTKTEKGYNPTKKVEICRDNFSCEDFQQILELFELDEDEVGETFLIHRRVDSENAGNKK